MMKTASHWLQRTRSFAQIQQSAKIIDVLWLIAKRCLNHFPGSQFIGKTDQTAFIKKATPSPAVAHNQWQNFRAKDP
jgi:hypothetical protein